MFLGLMLAFAGETIFGIVVDRVSNRATDAAVKAITTRLGNGRIRLPENHDIERAHRESTRFAFEYLIAQALPKLEGEPSASRSLFSRAILARPPATAGFGAAEPRSVLEWCRSLERLLEDDDWIDGWSADPLALHALESVAAAKIDGDLLDAFHESALGALRESRLPPVPALIDEAVRHGWSAVDPRTDAIEQITLYGAYCLRFQALIAHDSVLAQKVEMNSRAALADRLDTLAASAAFDPDVVRDAVRNEVGPASALLVEHLESIERAVERVAVEIDALSALLADVDRTTRRTESVAIDIKLEVAQHGEILRRLAVWADASTTPAMSGTGAADGEPIDVEALLAELALRLGESTATMPHVGIDLATDQSAVDAMPLARRRTDGKAPDAMTVGSLDRGESFVLTGGPGTGKSTILQWLVRRELVEPSGVPVYVLCRTLPDAVLDGSTDLLGALVENAASAIPDLPGRERAALRERMVDDLVTGRALLALDGLNEIADGARRSQFTARLTSTLSERSRVVVTTREPGSEGAVMRLAERLARLSGEGGLGRRPSRQYSIASLDGAAQRALLDAWADADPDRAELYAGLRDALAAGGASAGLADTVFALSLLVEEMDAGGRLPDKLRELYRKILERTIERERDVTPPLRVDEVFPRLEHVALGMARRGIVEVAESDIAAMLRRFDALELDDFPSVAPRRTPYAFLAAVLSTGLLVDVGDGPRRRGIPQRMFAFFHQSFQGYFAGRAIVHRWAESGRAVDDVRDVVGPSFDGSDLPPQWMETLPHVIDAAESASLDARWFGVEPAASVDELLSVFITRPSGDTSQGTLDVLGVGLTGLASASPLTVSPEVSHRLIETAVDALEGARRPAGWSEAIRRLLASPWRDDVIGILRGADSRPARNWAAGLSEHIFRADLPLDDVSRLLATSLQRALTAQTDIRRSEALLEIVELAFRAHGTLGGAETPDAIQPAGVGGLAAEDKATVWDALIGLHTGGADPRLVAWALVWMSGARTPVGDVDGLSLRHREWVAERILALVEDPVADASIVADVSLLAVLPWGGMTSAYAQADWVYHWAVVADGAVPRRAMPPLSGGIDEPLASVLVGLLGKLPPWAAGWVAIAASRAGSRDAALVDPLWAVVVDQQEWDAVRDEAWFTLLGIGGERVASLLRAAIAAEDEFVQLRGAIGTVAIASVPELVALAEPWEHYDDAYVFALYGHDDPRGPEEARRLAREHPDAAHRARIADAIARADTAWADA
ncbi:hypothetical protein FBY39_1408 [Microbacterium sp. SLBN-146]|nr:hypothetical protein FBY39_1408 [Microbacterium sp. SLBN-146]